MSEFGLGKLAPEDLGPNGPAASRPNSRGPSETHVKTELVIDIQAGSGSENHAMHLSFSSSRLTQPAGADAPTQNGMAAAAAAALSEALAGIGGVGAPEAAKRPAMPALPPLPLRPPSAGAGASGRSKRASLIHSESIRRAMAALDDEEGAEPIQARFGGLFLRFADGPLESRYLVWRRASPMPRALLAAGFWAACWVAGTAARGRTALGEGRFAAFFPAVAFCVGLVASTGLAAGLMARSSLVRRHWQHGVAALMVASAGIINYLTIFEMYDAKYPLIFCATTTLEVQLGALSFGLHTTPVALLSGFSALLLLIETLALDDLRASNVAWVAVALLCINFVAWTYTSIQLETGKRMQYHRADVYTRRVKQEAARSEKLLKELNDLRREKEAAAARARETGFAISQPIERVMRAVAGLRDRADEDGREADVAALDDLLETVTASGSLFAPELTPSGPDVEEPLLASWIQSELAPLEHKRSRLPRTYSVRSAAAGSSRHGPNSARGIQGSRHGWSTARRVGNGESSPAAGGPAKDPLEEICATLLPTEEVALRALLPKAKEWGFDAMELDEVTQGRALRLLAVHFFHELGFVRRFQLDANKLLNFVEAVDAAYNANWYHNATHAADVLQGAVSFLSCGALRLQLTDLERMAVVLAAVVHDMGHEGRNNNFEIANASERALIYNDRSVLENYHASRCFLLLRQANCDFLAALSPADRKALRRSVVEAILATDIAKHFETVGALKAHAASQKSDDRQLFVNATLKCADLGNAARPSQIYFRWADWVMHEFFDQGDDERRLGMPISPWMDREKPQVPMCQSGFIDFVVDPLYSAWAAIFPDFQTQLDIVKTNRAHWKRVQLEAGGTLSQIHSAVASPAAPRSPINVASGPVSMRRRGSNAHGSTPGSSLTGPAFASGLAAAAAARALSQGPGAGVTSLPHSPASAVSLIPSIAMLVASPAQSPKDAELVPPPLPPITMPPQHPPAPVPFMDPAPVAPLPESQPQSRRSSGPEASLPNGVPDPSRPSPRDRSPGPNGEGSGTPTDRKSALRSGGLKPTPPHSVSMRATGNPEGGGSGRASVVWGTRDVRAFDQREAAETVAPARNSPVAFVPGAGGGADPPYRNAKA